MVNETFSIVLFVMARKNVFAIFWPYYKIILPPTRKKVAYLFENS